MLSSTTYETVSTKISQHWFTITNFLIFQVVWGVSVFGRESLVLASVALLTLHFALSRTKKRDALTLVFIGVCGIALDATLSFFGVFVFHNDVLMPSWLALLWCAFALTLNHSMAWIIKLNVIKQSVLGAVGGTFSYWMGYNFGAVEFSFSILLTCVILFVAWSCVFPLFCWYVRSYAFRH